MAETIVAAVGYAGLSIAASHTAGKTPGIGPLCRRGANMPTLDPFEAYPETSRLHRAIGGPGRLLREHFTRSLPALEDSLSRISVSGRPSLLALAKDLFSDDQGKVEAAICEFLAFGWLKQKALITDAEIGYPRDWPGDDPPFEGVLASGGAEYAFDVKDGSGSGLQLLIEVLERALAREATKASVRVPALHVAVDAPSGQRWVADNFRMIVDPFCEDLRRNGFSDRILTYKAGAGHIKVGINRRVGASVMGLNERSSFIASQMVAHASHKARQLGRTTSARMFLIYVRRPGSAVPDFSVHSVPPAFDFLAGSSALPAELAGVLFLDFDGQGDSAGCQAILWDRAGDLARLFDGLDCEMYLAEPTPMPEENRAIAQSLPPGELESTAEIMAGSCDLRGAKCLAAGSTGAVLAYFHGDDQYLACSECREEFGWPPPSGAAQEP